MPRLIAETSSGWVSGRPADIERRAPWPTPSAPDPSVRAPWPAARSADASRAAGWIVALAADAGDKLPWGPGQHADAGAIRAPWVISAQADRQASLGGEGAALVPKSAVYVIPWGISAAADAEQRIAGTGGLAARPAETGRAAPWGQQAAADTLTWAPWGMGRIADGGVIIIVPPPDPGDADETPAVPILECYIVINAVSLVRADNGAEIPAEALQLGIGRDGPHWTWSASLPGYARALVEDRPEVIATLNGTPIRLLVERVRRDRRASLRGVSDAVQIAGRSPSAWLSDPFAPASARTSENPYTAQQLAAEALTLNGVSVGWALDWRLPDWLVPAGAWSHLGTPMEAVLRIAEAGGGYVQAAAATQTLRALPHYPAAPWLWASLAPDLMLPEDVVEVEGTDTAGGAGYDVVYVEGIGPAGRRDRVRRTGTAGVLPAPQIIDPLATDLDMTRARGLAALAASSPQTRVTLRLPVLQETGLILPGTLLDYAAEGATHRGIVRSFRADWTHPELWQSVEVECHG